MRILMLNYEYPPLGGGGSNACKYILKEFAKKNLEVDLVTSSPANTFESENIGIITYSLRVRSFIKNLLIEKEYDICYAFFGIPCGAIAYLFREKMPYIVSLRSMELPVLSGKWQINNNKRCSLF